MADGGQGRKGIRVSLENFAAYDRVQTIPMYAASRLVQPGNAGVD